MSSRAHKITRRKIRCLHLIPTMGYSKWEAVAGDMITYKEQITDGSFNRRMARVVGWVKAPFEKGSKPEYDCPAFEGVCVVALNDEGTCCYERWIKPEDILSINTPSPKFLFYFGSADPQELLRASEYGSASASHTDFVTGFPALPCGFPSCPAEHQHRADGTPNRMAK